MAIVELRVGSRFDSGRSTNKSTLSKSPMLMFETKLLESLTKMDCFQQNHGLLVSLHHVFLPDSLQMKSERYNFPPWFWNFLEMGCVA